MAITLHTHCLCHALPFGNEVEICVQNAILNSTPKQHRWRIMRYKL